MSRRVHRNDKKNLSWAFKKCPGSLYFTLLKYRFSLIFSNHKIFSNDIKLLFVELRTMKFNLDM